MHRCSKRILLWVVATSVVVSGCLFDSRYIQQKSAQKNVAQQQTPHALQGTPADGVGALPHPAARVLRVRVHATTGYAVETVEWPRQFARLIEDVNRIVEPTLDARLDVVGASSWNPELPNDDLDPLLSKLRHLDAGDDVDCVVGLAGSLPVFAHSFHQLGLGEILGKHIVVRGMNDAREREALEVELSRLAAEDREALYQTRKRHKATAVFLHELGHNLGAIHETDDSFIMNARYAKSMSGFSPASAEVMRITLEHRSKQGESERVLAEQLLGHFDASAHGWVAADRENMFKSLKTLLAQPASGATAPAALADDAALRDVAAADRSLLVEAIADERQGKPRDAWTKAEPLFARYKDVYVVQDLRCKLAMELSTVWEFTRAECEALMGLNRGKGAKKDGPASR